MAKPIRAPFRTLLGDARELASYVLWDDMLTDAPEKRESAQRMKELARKITSETDNLPPEE